MKTGYLNLYVVGNNKTDYVLFKVIAIDNAIIKRSIMDLKDICQEHGYPNTTYKSYILLHLTTTMYITVDNFEYGKDIIWKYLIENNDLSSVSTFDKNRISEEDLEVMKKDEGGSLI